MNPQPAALDVTYAQLTSLNGVIGRACLSCHNSVQRSGGFDIADYEDLITPRMPASAGAQPYYLLAPGQDKVEYDANFVKKVTAVSHIYRRLLPEFTPTPLLMPRDRTLTPDELNQIERWLTTGAKNN